MILPILNPSTNPIAQREIRAYLRSTPLWLRRAETVGIIAISLVLGAYLIMRVITERAEMPIMFFYQLLNFSTYEYVQIVIWIVYAGILLRCIFAGVGVAHRYQGQMRNDLRVTNLSSHQIVIGQWLAALYQIRGWMVALGFIRIAAVIALAADFQFNLYWNHLEIIRSIATCFSFCDPSQVYQRHPLQIPVSFAFTIILGFCEVWATTGIGILSGSWFRSSAAAWAAALFLRLLPIAIFSWFPSVASSSSPYDLLSVRWEEYTWFAFADGGTGSLLRLTVPNYIAYKIRAVSLTRGFLAFFAAFHLLVSYSASSYFFAKYAWRTKKTQLIKNVRKERFSVTSHNISYENIGIVGIALVSMLYIVVRWLNSPRIIPTLRIPFYYNDAILYWLESCLLLAIIATTIRGIFAGVHWLYPNNGNCQLERSETRNIFCSSIHVSGRLRGWFLGLGLLFLGAFALLVLEHTTNFHSASMFSCRWLAPDVCYHPSLRYPLAQWILGLLLSITLSWTILFSSVFIGITIRMIIKESSAALLVAFAFRALPIIGGQLMPDTDTINYGDGVLITRWWDDFLMIFGDSGISALFGLAEPTWHNGHVFGLKNITYSLFAFILVLYMLLFYMGASLALAKLAAKRAMPKMT
jgi:hypothetical protein